MHAWVRCCKALVSWRQACLHGCLIRLRVREADLNCRTWGAIHPCAFHRGAWGTLSLTTLHLDKCNLDVLPYQART